MTTTHSDKRTAVGRYLVVGAVTLAILVAVAVGGSYLYQKRFGPTKATAADCALAQEIVNEAQHLPADQAKVDKWKKDMHALRFGQDPKRQFGKPMDGYLGSQVSLYEGWAGAKATGKGALPTPAEFKAMETEANAHCDKKVVFPPIS